MFAMLTAIVLVVFPAAQAAQTTKDIRFCFDIDIDFIDYRTGDWFTDNGTVPGRGLRVGIPDDTGMQWVWMDNDGCKDVEVTVTSGILYVLTVKSKARVNGVTLEAYDGEDALDPSGALKTLGWISHLYAQDEVSHTIPEDDNVWNLLAVGSWAMHRNTMNLGTYSDRGCCHDNVDADGSCTPNPPWIPDWYGPSGDATIIRMYNHHGGSSQPPCCLNAAGIPGAGEPPNWQNWCAEFDDPPGSLDYCTCKANMDDWCEAAVGVSTPLKFLIAHELGHVVVMKRMGQRSHVDLSAPLKNCMGDFNNDITVPIDSDDLKSRGSFTQEYHSNAAREGWANFFAAWLWNKRSETDCTWDSWKVHDIDLDGDLDNNYDDTAFPDTGAVGEPWDGRYQCDGNPIGVEPRPADPLKTYANGMDWLELMYDETTEVTELCWDESGLTDIDTDVAGLGTVFDWMRFWWDMTKTSGGNIGPATLTDVYVDMCPTTWEDPPTGAGDSRVIKRLEISADHHGVGPEWTTWKANGQDH